MPEDNCILGRTNDLLVSGWVLCELHGLEWWWTQADQHV
jgi:hypothetical protein